MKGPVVTKGYDHLEEATSKGKIKDGDTIWHRMGDSAYLDEDGSIWFCGRVAERVQATDGVLFTDPIEAIFNQQNGVFRSALIGLGEPGNQVPAIVIEPEQDQQAGEEWSEILLNAIPEDSSAAQVKRVFFHKSFPVDVRHNAKIHRLTLAKEFRDQ